MKWSRKWSMDIISYFQKISIVVAFFYETRQWWCIVLLLQTYLKCLLDWRADLSAQTTGCWQFVVITSIKFGTQNPDLQVLRYLLETRETGDQFLFQRRTVSSLQQSGIWILNVQLNLKLLLTIICREGHGVSWIFKVQMGSCYVKTIVYFPCISFHWALNTRRKTLLKKFVRSIRKSESDNFRNKISISSQLK